MMNQVMIVGKLAGIAEKFIIVNVSASNRNADGEYDIYHIKVGLQPTMINNVFEHCQVGSVLGVKGHIEETNGNVRVIGDRISFLG